MIIKKLHTPEGVKDYLPSECILKTKIENNVSKVFKSFGYVPVKSPTFEYSDVFDNKGSVSDKNLYRFVDRDGSILTLRSVWHQLLQELLQLHIQIKNAYKT